jgi:hypothetical protein
LEQATQESNIKMHMIDSIIIIILILLLIWAIFLFEISMLENEPMKIKVRRVLIFLIDMDQQVSIEIDRRKPEQFYEQIQEYENDPQNTHDHQVLKTLTKKFKRLCVLSNFSEKEISSFKIISQEINEIFEELNKLKKPNKEDSFKIESVLEQISKSSTISSIHDEAVPESLVLKLVWMRINDPSNKANRENMMEILYEQLLDCITSTEDEELEFHCINGRVGRMLSVLTMTDSDSILSEPEKGFSEIANMCYQETAQILKKELETERMIEIYQKDPDELTLAEQNRIDEFRISVEKLVEEKLTSEYKEILTDSELLIVINNAKLGIA